MWSGWYNFPVIPKMYVGAILLLVLLVGFYQEVLAAVKMLFWVAVFELYVPVD